MKQIMEFLLPVKWRMRPICGDVSSRIDISMLWFERIRRRCAALSTRCVFLSIFLLLQAVISFYWLWLYPGLDEAVHMYNSYRVSQGDLPYRDFFSYVTPGTYLLGGGLLSLVSGKIVYLRILMVAFALGGIVLMDRILQALVGEGFVRSLWLAVYVSVTALSATYFSHHSLDHFLFVVLLFSITRHEENRASFAWLGSVIAADSFVHQAHGFYYCVAVSVYLLFLSPSDRAAKIRYLVAFIFPILVLYGVFVGWLVATGSLLSFLNDAIFWVLDVYGKDFAFGLFEDTLFYIKNGSNVGEQGLFLVAKVGIIAACGFIPMALIAPKLRRTTANRDRLFALVLLAAGLGSLQTLHNPVAYYVLFFMAIGVYLLCKQPAWVLSALLLCMSVQMARVGTFPIRHAHEYDLFSRHQFVKLNQNYLSESSEAAVLAELFVRLRERNIEKAVVIGRSPEVYLLTGLKNPTRHDVITPLYLSEGQLASVAPHVAANVVVYDKTMDKLKVAQDFFDFHHYRKNPETLKKMDESELFRQMRQKPLLFEVGSFKVYGIENSERLKPS